MDNVYVAALRASQKHEYERGWIGDREHRARLVVAWVAHLAVRQWARLELRLGDGFQGCGVRAGNAVGV